MSATEILLGVALGVGLAAAAGLRVFLPLLAVAIAAKVGLFGLSPNYAWLGSPITIAVLGVAALIEIAGYYIPGVDHVLDLLTGPIALVAGTMMVVAPLDGLPPVVKWTTAIIAGGGVAAITKGLSSLLRVKSTVATAGLANPVVATSELGSSLVLTLVSLLAPVFGAIVVLLALGWVLRRLFRRPGKPGVDPAG